MGTDCVCRPDPGLASGKWEAPSWLLWVLLAVALVGAAAFVVQRAGLIKLVRRRRAR